VIIGDLPGGLAHSWLAHFRLDGRRTYTVVVVAAAASVTYAVRMLCHDRDLPDSDASNPEAWMQTVEMDDRSLPFESAAFLERYTVKTDHDQDPLRAWQLFSPALIHWLTTEAPKDFSFELQNGALCGFVLGALADPAELDALCEATATIHTRVLEIDAVAGPAAAGSREDTVERELAKHPFAKPPRSARVAAFRFGLPFISRSARRLGAEAFFRAHVAALGLERIEPDAFMASHIQITIPGRVTHVAQGRLPHTQLDGYLVFTTDAAAGGWSVVIADITREDNGFAFAVIDGGRGREDWEEKGLDISSNGDSIFVWKPDGSPGTKTARKLEKFLEDACPWLERAVTAAKRRPG
jgi:hypothetical protein